MSDILVMLLTVMLVVGWVPLAAMLLYLLVMTGVAAIPYRGVPQASTQRTFRIIIPAHNEELVLEPVLHRLMHLRYPQSKVEVIVIADNCSDRTADVAHACGVRVLQRFEQQALGKGHALTYAFAALQNEQFDAYVVLDADTLVDPDLLTVFNDYLAAGHRIMQAHYDVLNPFETQQTALMHVAFRIFNYVRPLGRRQLGVSTGLKGNGMCFAKSVIDRYTWNAFSIAEDIEYTTTLLVNGERIVFAPEARIWAQMPTTRAHSASQRLRWEGGRLPLARRDGLHFIGQGIRHRNLSILDWGMDLLIPPLAMFTLLILGGTVLATALMAYVTTPTAMSILVAWLALLAVLALFVGTAMRVGRLPKQAYTALLSVPGYVAWKLWIYAVLAVRHAPHDWIRTDRARIHDHHIGH